MSVVASLLAIFSFLWNASSRTLNFDTYRPGALPPGWSSAITHYGGVSEWRVVADASAPSQPNVLAQTSAEKEPGRFPLAIFDSAAFQDGDVTVWFKAVEGTREQCAGVVFRYRDANNYYVVEANAREDRVLLSKVQDGRQVALALRGRPWGRTGVKHHIPAGRWNQLHVRIRGSQFRVYYDHYQLFEVVDSSFRGPGKAGLWTLGDSVVHFDNFQVRY